MYKCNLFKCDGAWGTSSAFADHLLGAKHLVAYFHDVRDRILSEEDVTEAALAECEAVLLVETCTKNTSTTRVPCG